MSFFEKITDGLKLYEVLMLSFGSLLFLVMLVLLVLFAVLKRPLKQLLLYFGVAVLMLGWPSLQKIKIDDTGVDVEKTAEQYAEKPTEENKKKVADLIGELKDRDVKDPDIVKKIARAEFMIGKTQEALQTIETLPVKEKQDSSINQLRASIHLSDSLKAQLHVVQNNVADSNQIKKLNELHSHAVSLPIKNPELDSSIHVANQKITEYQIRNPRVKIRTTGAE
jgi:hypothetical protein